VVTTPREQYWAFGAYACLLAVVAALADVPAAFIARRLVVELPFVAFAVLLPFVAHGPYVDVFGLSMSEPGLLAAWNVLAKGTLGVTSSILLAATTDARELIVGMQRLRVPNLLVEITSFMVRYADVVVDEMRRMRIARESRGFQARHAGHIPVVARSAGALFIRSYERGERVHLAMLSRGYRGALPPLDTTIPVAATARWHAVSLPVAAAAIAVLAWLSR
jgi:cobalt/nickel transport system permease protein